MLDNIAKILQISVLVACFIGFLSHPLLVDIGMKYSSPMDYNVSYLTIIILAAFTSAVTGVYLSFKTYSLYKFAAGELKKRTYYLLNFFIFTAALSINTTLGWGYFLISGNPLSYIDLGIIRLYPFILAMQYYFILGAAEGLFLFCFTMQFFDEPKLTLRLILVLMFYVDTILCLLPFNYFGFKAPSQGLYTKPIIALLLFMITLTAIFLGISITRKKLKMLESDIQMKMRYAQLQLAYIFHLMLMLFYFIYSVLFELHLYDLAYISIGIAALSAILSSVLYYGSIVGSRYTTKVAELFWKFF